MNCIGRGGNTVTGGSMKQSDIFGEGELAPGQFIDKKHEGHSGLSKKNEAKRRKEARTEAGKEGKEVQLKYIDNL